MGRTGTARPSPTVDAHRLDMIRAAREVNREAGIPDGPFTPPEHLRKMMVADGVRQEDNAFSADIVRARSNGAGD